MTVKELIEHVEELIENHLSNDHGLRNDEYFLPIYLKQTTKAVANEEPIDRIRAWLKQGDNRVPIAQIFAPIGSGKTITTCRLQKSLQEDCDRQKAVVWIPLRALEGTIKTANPNALIPNLLDIPSHGHNLAAHVYCCILDGIDEFLSGGSERERLDTIAKILETFCQAHVPVIISGRDMALDHRSSVYLRLREKIESLCHLYGELRHTEPLSLELQSWEDDEVSRKALISRLRKSCSHKFIEIREEEIEDHVNNIKQGVLTKPLLFGLAYELILRQLEQKQQTSIIKNEWELIEQAITSCFFRETKNRHPITPHRDRRRVAQRIAMYLVCSGKGISGVSISDLANHPLHWIWEPLQAPNAEEREPDAALDGKAEELIDCCLLKTCLQKRLAPFHQQVLLHLAAEGFESLFTGTECIDGSATLVQPNPWAAIADQIQFSGLIDLGEFISRYLEGGSALNPNSDFEQALRYWLMYKQKDLQAPNLDLSSFLQDETTDELRRVIGAVARFLKVLKCPNRKFDATKIDFFGKLYILVPSGRYLVWDQDNTGNAIPILEELSNPYLLAERLVTVGEYADFLQENRDVKLPNDSASNWHRDNTSFIVTFNSSCAEQPICGISNIEAQSYCEWLTTKLNAGSKDRNSEVGFQLPPSSLLRIAATPSDLRTMNWEDSGPFGHSDLICKKWHYTNDASSSGNQVIVFGGSENLSEDPTNPEKVASLSREQQDKAQKIYENGYPQGIREVPPLQSLPDCGFRVALFIAKEELSRILFSAKEELSMVMSPTSPPDPPPTLDKDPNTLTDNQIAFLAQNIAELLPPGSQEFQIIEELLPEQFDHNQQYVSPEKFWLNMLLIIGGDERRIAPIIDWKVRVSAALLEKNHAEIANSFSQLFSNLTSPGDSL